MTINEAIDYIYASYMKAEPYLKYDAPDCEKRNPLFSKAVIEKRKKVPTVLVTGSKGKGSVSKMIAEIMATYCKTGLMTSPHILKFNERIQVQGEPVSDEVLAAAIEKLKPEFDVVEAALSQAQYISPMGLQAAAALDIFKETGVEFQVMECGKGVKYDDVNHVSHKYAVINHIFLEHTRELGTTLEEIAENKSAIMTGEQAAVFTSTQEPAAMAVLKKRAELMKTPLYQYGKHFWCEEVRYTKFGMMFDVVTLKHRYTDLQIPLLGTYQAENCALAIALCEEELGVLEIEKLRRALQCLEWPGRLEILSSEPLIILDACINRESCKNVLEALKELQTRKAAVIIGIPSDKDYLGVAEEMTAVAEHIILTKSSNTHYKFDASQIETLQTAGITAGWADDIAQAVDNARNIAAAEGEWNRPMVILGTTSLISDVKALAATPMPL